MREMLESSQVWGIFFTLVFYAIFWLLQKRIRSSLCNPLLLTTIVMILFLTGAGIPYTDYKGSSSLLSWLLLPATVSLAIPLYEQWDLLRRNVVAILTGIFSGVVTSLLCALLLTKLFHLPADQAVSFLPKSVTTAIGADVSAELGGIPSLTIVLIILTGIVGNVLAPSLCHILRLRNPISRGLAIGTASHAIGTAKAMEMGETEGAVSGLAIAVAGIMTALLCPLFAALL